MVLDEIFRELSPKVRGLCIGEPAAELLEVPPDLSPRQVAEEIHQVGLVEVELVGPVAGQ
jgi:hypothetical protein